MPIERPYGGKVYEFPDDATEEEIFNYLKLQPAAGPSAPKIPMGPPASAEGSETPVYSMPARLLKAAVVDPAVSAVQQAQQGEVSPLLTTIGGTPFPFIGAGIGSAVGQTMEQSLYGRRPDFVGIGVNALADALTNKSFDLLGKGVVKTGAGLVRAGQRFGEIRQPGDSIRDTLKQMFFERLNRNADAASIAASQNTNVPLSVGQVLNNRRLMGLEQILGGKHYDALQTAQREAAQKQISQFSQEFVKPGDLPDLRSQDLARANKQQMELNEAAARAELESIRAQNVQTLREVTGKVTTKNEKTGRFETLYETKPRRIVPVDYNNAWVAMRNYEPIINDLFGNNNMQRLPKSFVEPYKEAKQLIDSVKNTTEILRKGKDKPDVPASIKTFRAAVREVEAIDEFLAGMGDKVPTELSEPKQILTGIRDAIEADIETAIAGWNKGGAAARARTTAKRIKIERENLFPDPMAAAIKGNPSEFFQAAFKNADEAVKVKASLSAEGNEKAAQELMTEEYWLNMVKENSDPKTWAEKLSRDPSAPVFLGKNFSRIMEFSRVMGNAARQAGGGEAALKMREGGLAATGLTSVITGNFNYAFKRALALSSMLVGSRGVAKMLLNEKNAKLAARLAKVKPDSPEAKFAMKSLLLGLKGQQVRLQVPNFGVFPAFVNDQGKLEVQSFDPEDQP